jgi:hypothetical protein
LFPRRRGGSDSWLCFLLFFPRVLVQLVGLEGSLPFHHRFGKAIIQVGLKALAQGAHLLARDTQFARKAAGALAFGEAPQQEHQRGGCLSGLGKSGVGQDSVVAVAGLAAEGRELAALLGNAPLGGAAAWALESLWVQVFFQPGQASGLIHQAIKGKVKHADMLSDCAA